MAYLFAALFIVSILFGGLFFFKNFTFSTRSTGVFPSIYRISEVKTHSVLSPEVIQRIDSIYSTLSWKYSDEDFIIIGMVMPMLYPIYAYEARVDDTTSVRVEFCEGGQANVKKIVGKDRVSEEYIRSQYADTYVFKLLRNGAIVDSWAYKELDAEGSK